MSTRGGGVLPLEQGHAETRERWTLQTTSISSAERARDVPLVELLFKADGDSLVDKLQALAPSWLTCMSVVTSLQAS